MRAVLIIATTGILRSVRGIGVSNPEVNPDAETNNLDALAACLDESVAEMATAPSCAKPGKIRRVLDSVRDLLLHDGGCALIETRASALERAGIFEGSDWASPHTLIPSLTTYSLKSTNPDTVIIEAISELRLLAIALGDYEHADMSAESARHYLTQMLAINLDLLFGSQSEAQRQQPGRQARGRAPRLRMDAGRPPGALRRRPGNHGLHEFIRFPR